MRVSLDGVESLHPRAGMNKVVMRTLAWVLAVGLLMGAYSYGWDLVAYWYALRLESKWSAASPKSRNELEEQLSLYSRTTISPRNSSWGRYYTLKANERMVRYNIMLRAPLDVVYDNEDRIIGIYTSYE